MNQSVASTSTASGAKAATQQSQQSREMGVRFKHIRYQGTFPTLVEDEQNKGSFIMKMKTEIFPHGGTTIAYRLLKGPDPLSGAYEYEYAIARCDINDAFIKSYGRSKAMGRLLSKKHRFTVKVYPHKEERNGVSQLEDPDKALHRFFDSTKFRAVEHG